MFDDRTAAGFIRQMPFKTYKNYKLNMLIRDFCLPLTKEELAQYKTFTTETEIDRFCVTMLNKYW